LIKWYAWLDYKGTKGLEKGKNKMHRQQVEFIHNKKKSKKKKKVRQEKPEEKEREKEKKGIGAEYRKRFNGGQKRVSFAARCYKKV